MARFSGLVGYGETIETAPDVFADRITEFTYYGDVVRNTRTSQQGEYLNNDISVSNSISIVADAYARDHFFAIRFVVWAGKPWHVTDVDATSPPRLILRLGGIYNGPRADPVTEEE